MEETLKEILKMSWGIKWQCYKDFEYPWITEYDFHDYFKRKESIHMPRELTFPYFISSMPLKMENILKV